MDNLAEAEDTSSDTQEVKDNASTRETYDEIVPVPESAKSSTQALDEFDGPKATDNDKNRPKVEKEALKKRIKDLFKKIEAYWKKRENAFFINLWKFAAIHIYKLVLVTIALVCINKVIYYIKKN